MSPQPGDVLVSKRTARIEHEISIVPAQPHLVSPTHDAAVGTAQELAAALKVDAWLTEDHAHFLRILSSREAGPPG